MYSSPAALLLCRCQTTAKNNNNYNNPYSVPHKGL